MMSSPKRPFRIGKQRQRHPLDLPLPDLMTPPGKTGAIPREGPWIEDLGLGELADALTLDRRYVSFVRRTLSTLCADPEVIAYRQAVLLDLKRDPRLREGIQNLLPRLGELRQTGNLLGNRQRALLLETVDRLSELDLYLSVVKELHTLLSTSEVRSAALREVREVLRVGLAGEGFKALAEELPLLQAPLRSLAALTVGINLDADLRPSSVMLLSIHERPFAETAPLLERLLGTRLDGQDETGIAPLHGVPADPALRPLSQLFQDLDRITQQTAQPVARALSRYVKHSSAPLHRLDEQLAWYVAAAQLMITFEQRGTPTCLPEILPAEARITAVEGLSNAALVLRKVKPVASDLQLNETARIAILTGPNSGGKTTYLRSVGLAQVMAQTGLFLTARRAQISPVDAILTHFPALETRQQGRLAEEAARLRQIFEQVSDQSLILLNESLASTTPAEALYLAQDVVCGLRVIGARGIFATHLVELAAQIPHMESVVEGPSRLSSWVAGVEMTADGRMLPTFQIGPGLPLEGGYAREVAQKHGISLAQILALRQDRQG